MRTAFFAGTLWFLGAGGCSTTELTPPDPPAASAPPYAKVQHPEGYALSDVRTLFLDPSAPKLESLKDCDADYLKLQSLIQSKDELREGIREFVRKDPVQTHWCFYGKILLLENELASDDFIDLKQKKTLEAYGYFVPIARAFESEFHDSRYLRFAVQHYRRVSEWIFYRKLDLTPQLTSELVDAANPFDYWRKPSSAGTAVLDKYGITRKPASTDAAAPTAPSAAPSGAPNTPRVFPATVSPDSASE